MNNKKQKLIKADLLTSNERCFETYSELYDHKIQEFQKILGLKMAQCEANSTYDKTMSHWMIDQDPGDDGNLEKLDPIEDIPTPAWVAITQGTKKEKKEYKAQVIKKWVTEALEKDRRVRESIPFSNISCPACQATMKYDWSIMYDRGTLNELDEQVLHAYICPKCEQREAIFEDGIYWSSNSGGRCWFCQSIRATTVTKDHCSNIFLIHKCLRCGTTQVEEGNNGLS